MDHYTALARGGAGLVVVEANPNPEIARGEDLAEAWVGPMVTAMCERAGFTPRVREIAFLTTSREMDNQFEWTAHEPVALEAGVPEAVIDVIKHRKPTDGLDGADAAEVPNEFVAVTVNV